MNHDTIAGLTCPNCGAPVRQAICEYCGAETGLTEDIVFNDHRTLSVRSVELSRLYVVSMFLLSFFTLAFVTAIFIILSADGFSVTPVVISVIFWICGLYVLFCFLSRLIRHFLTKIFGKSIKGKVYGYTQDGEIIINGSPTQKIKILTEIGGETVYIYVSTHRLEKIYTLGSTIAMRYYRGNVLLVQD